METELITSMQSTANERIAAKPNLRDMSCEEIESFITELGKEKYRTRQIMKWLYQSNVSSFSDMTTLSRDFRAQMDYLARIGRPEIAKILTSADGTKKILFRLEDGLGVESVLIPGKSRWTLCVSTQAGCQMGCRFCLTGRNGFVRDLLPSEITGQISGAIFDLPGAPPITNVVMMGMGEPLANYANTIEAVKLLTSDWGFGYSTRKVTVSSCGIPPMIEQLGRDICVNLAVSLNAPDNQRRSFLMPINRKYPLEDLLAACRNYPMPGRRMLTFEYILIDDVNDSPGDAEKLARLLKGIRCKLNLIAFNEFPGADFRTPADERVIAFQQILMKHNYTAIIRASKGRDILAACGQLGGQAGREGGK